jgi:hypothetical protein
MPIPNSCPRSWSTNSLPPGGAGAPYDSMADVVRRTGITAKQVDALAAAGAFDCFGLDRRQAIWQAGAAVTIPVEVKNLRDWMLPASPEVYQLLEKAAAVQAANPKAAIMPVLICRRVHFTLFRMAKDLGFFVSRSVGSSSRPTSRRSWWSRSARNSGFSTWSAQTPTTP